MKRVALVILLIVSSMSLQARERSDESTSRMTFGLEWGYVASISSGFHYNYFAPEGYRVDELGNSFVFISNADMYLHLGYDLSTIWNLSMYVGYEGIAELHKAIPVSLRMTRYFSGNPLEDRWFSFLDLGSGICLKMPVQEILTGKAGIGYSLSLSSHASLDFILSARMTYTHPQVIYDNTLIPFDRTNRNNAYIGAISLGMAVTF